MQKIASSSNLGIKTLPQIYKSVAIMAGKGGVGKSTIAVNLAIALKKIGMRVGILDADLYGPSIPQLLNIDAAQMVVNDNKIMPFIWQEIPVVSMNFFIQKHEAIIWRGPMVSRTIENFIVHAQWPELDYLIIDMPPGTGDIQLTLTQKIPPTAAIAVGVPQKLVLHDVLKAVNAYKKLKIPILGIIENMSNYTCPHCCQNSVLFNDIDFAEWAMRQDLEVLGRIPIKKDIMDLTLWEQQSNSDIFQTIAHNIIVALQRIPRSLPVKILEDN